VQDVTVRGLDGIAYLDKTDNFREKMQSGEIGFTRQTDRIYLNARDAVDVVDTQLGRIVRTEKVNSENTVVWNPGIEQTAKIADLADDDWQRMVCVEGSNVQTAAIELNPGAEHTLRVTLSAVSA
jgi:glucose-6-phosphate 1-epimerase